MRQNNIRPAMAFLLIFAAILLPLLQLVPVLAEFNPVKTPIREVSLTPPPVPSSTVPASGFLYLEMADYSTSVPINEQGQISQTLAGSMPNDSFSLSIEAGTQVLANRQEISSPVPEFESKILVPQKISVEALADIPGFPLGWEQVSPAFDVYGLVNGQRQGISLDQNALLVIKFNPENLPANLEGLSTFYYDKLNGWTPVEPPAGFIAEAGQSACVTNHFSLFTVLAKSEVKSPANIVVQKMTVNPPHITVGQSSEVRIKVMNKGGLAGEYNLVLKMGEQIQKSQLVYLEAGQATEVALVLTPGKNGLYSLSAGSALGSLIVDSGEKADVGETSYWWLLYLAMAVSLLIFLLFTQRYLSKSRASGNQIQDSKFKNKSSKSRGD